MCNRENESVRYRSCEEWNTDPQLGRYCCYGILCEVFLPEHGWQICQSVHDVTDDADAAQALALLMQEGKLDPCHMLDVVEDFLNAM